MIRDVFHHVSCASAGLGELVLEEGVEGVGDGYGCEVADAVDAISDVEEEELGYYYVGDECESSKRGELFGGGE